MEKKQKTWSFHKQVGWTGAALRPSVQMRGFNYYFAAKQQQQEQQQQQHKSQLSPWLQFSQDDNKQGVWQDLMSWLHWEVKARKSKEENFTAETTHCSPFLALKATSTKITDSEFSSLKAFCTKFKFAVKICVTSLRRPASVQILPANFKCWSWLKILGLCHTAAANPSI